MTKEYVLLLSQRARKRHRHETVRGRIVAFMVQWEIQHQGKWKPILRYDSTHGFSHVDRYNLTGEQQKEALELTFEETLAYADADINKNWEEYQERFMRGRFP